MRIALVAPPIKSRYVQGMDEPLGLEYLAAVVEKDHDVCIIDAFNQRLTIEDTIMLLEEYRPDVVGMGLVMTGAHDPTLEICAAVKARFPKALTVLGGHTAMFVADSLVRRDDVDCVVWAEGESTFVELLQHYERGEDWRGVPGIVCAIDGEVTRTPKRENIPDLNAHPLPARHLLPGIAEYMISVLRSRGCAYYCPYCSVAAFWGGRMNRRRSDESVIAELEHIATHFPRETVAFADDTFTVPPKGVHELCRKMRSANLGLTWSCTGRVETITPELLSSMRDAGCTDMFFGIESGSEKVLRRLGRRYDANRVLDIYRMCIMADIRPRFSFIFGLPSEDWEAVEDTWRLIDRLEGVSVGVHILTPLPGTDIGEDPASFGIQVTTKHGVGDLDINSDVMIENGFLTKDQIREAYRRGAGLAARSGRKAIAIKRIRDGGPVPPIEPRTAPAAPPPAAPPPTTAAAPAAAEPALVQLQGRKGGSRAHPVAVAAER